MCGDLLKKSRAGSRQADLRARLEKVWANLPGLGTLAAVNHTTVGLRFMVTGAVFFLIGGLLAMLIRTQLALPEQDIIAPEIYNQLFTIYGTVMMFLFAIPILEGARGTWATANGVGPRQLVDAPRNQGEKAPRKSPWTTILGLKTRP